MIKFFRKIRQKLLTENKLSKYLIYAIGEIILVVIGILIALSINNWNEDRNNRKLITVYKKSLIENFVQDSIVIANGINIINSEITKIEQFEKRVSNSQEPLDTILKIARFEYEFRISINNHYEKDTYEVLNSTGHIGLFTNKLTKKLKELNSLQNRAIFNANQSFESYRNNLSNYSHKYPFSFRNNLIKNNTKAASVVWNNISKSEHATEFNALIIAKGDVYRLALGYLPDLKTKTNELLSELRKHK
ncbi:DUF6090 family protein [Gaetbulibacter saemankumensis]|uniref:DUF6090 family protein n=1 Tax=Gaetbulibacter saemankumensis TaxID=311208 RepID=UPI000414ACA2|nr:DUF6090 family protein [Gaetbulibacter saemankumensis]